MTDPKTLEIDQEYGLLQTSPKKTSTLILDLVKTLNDKDIPYCHWKSNLSLEKSLTGEIDLDLLIERKDLPRALLILNDFGFKQAMVKWGKQDPAIYHYYGFDKHTGRLIHVQLFSSVLTGESFLKSHLLPFEKMLLENISSVGTIKTTSKAAELVIFILRTFIKYGSFIDLVYLINSKGSLRTELNWLKADDSLEESITLLKEYCPVIEKDLFIKCIDAISSSKSIFNHIILARRVRKRLKMYRRFSVIKRLYQYMNLISSYVWHRLIRHEKNKMLCGGGAIIAFVGPEATGKSTLVTESCRWLGEIFSVKSVHAGKPPSSFISYPFNVFLPLLRKTMPGVRTSRQEGHVAKEKQTAKNNTSLKGLSSLLYAFRSVTLAWDRRRLLLKARKMSADGNLVICDRYPSMNTGAMDSPRLKKMNSSKNLKSLLYNKLAGIEIKLYQQIPSPNLVLQLTVSIETAKQRNRDRIKKGKESDAYLVSRHLQSKNWQIQVKTEIKQIDTEQSLRETILRVKKNIWQAL